MSKKSMLLVVPFLLLNIIVFANTTEDIDYKANFIINLIKHVEWPASAGTDKDGSVVINVVGETSLYPELQKLADSKSAKGQKIVIRNVSEPLTDCQILFISTSETSGLAKVLKKVKNYPILTISDAEYFGNYGVMINFIKEKDKGKSKVKFEVNQLSVSDAGIKISSKLLKQAKII